jgi:AcrR family transcriptional regulator
MEPWSQAIVRKNERKKRSYNSTRRRLQAQETRSQIVEAARRLFAARGYSGTTIEAIAEAAGVAAETVYAGFGSKKAVLARLIEVSVLGDDAPGSLFERPGPQEVQREADPRHQLELFARDIRTIMERVSPLFTIMRTAAPGEPEIAALLAQVLAERLEGMKFFLRALSAREPLRQGLSLDAAAETVWAITSAEVFRLLSEDRGWPPARYERWLADTLARLLLP